MLSVTAAPRFRAAAAFNFPRPVAELSRPARWGIVPAGSRNRALPVFFGLRGSNWGHEFGTSTSIEYRAAAAPRGCYGRAVPRGAVRRPGPFEPADRDHLDHQWRGALDRRRAHPAEGEMSLRGVEGVQ